MHIQYTLLKRAGSVPSILYLLRQFLPYADPSAYNLPSCSQISFSIMMNPPLNNCHVIRLYCIYYSLATLTCNTWNDKLNWIFKAPSAANVKKNHRSWDKNCSQSCCSPSKEFGTIISIEAYIIEQVRIRNKKKRERGEILMESNQFQHKTAWTSSCCNIDISVRAIHKQFWWAQYY